MDAVLEADGHGCGGDLVRNMVRRAEMWNRASIWEERGVDEERDRDREQPPDSKMLPTVWDGVRSTAMAVCAQRAF